MKTYFRHCPAGLLLVGVLLLMMLPVGCSRRPASVVYKSPDNRATTGDAKLKPYKVMGQWYYPIADASRFTQKGVASWYGSKFHGRKTANGETYDMHAMTAAHKTLPLGTYVQVENLNNGKEVTVRVNDRGPFVKGRIIDLSFAGATQLDMVEPGTAPVEITALTAPEIRIAATRHMEDKKAAEKVIFETGQFTVQVGSFGTRENAMALKTRLSERYENVHVVTFNSDGNTFYRVRAGFFRTLDQAKASEARLSADGFDGAFVIAE